MRGQEAASVVSACQAADKYIGILRAGPFGSPGSGTLLVQQGIESVSFEPDS